MTTFQYWILGLLAGGAISWLVSWFYFRKGSNKRLSTYIQVASGVLADTDDPTIRDALAITYHGVKISDLYQLQFVVANEGQRAIRDIIEPLTLTLPTTVEVLDARILHVEPTGRTVNVAWARRPNHETAVSFAFPVLNAREFFIAKLLLNGHLPEPPSTFTVSADDLPPQIRAKSQVFKPSEELPIVGGGAVFLGVFALLACLLTLYGFYLTRRIEHLDPTIAASGRDPSNNAILGYLLLPVALYWFGWALNLIVWRGFLGPRQRFQVPASRPNTAPRDQFLVVDQSALNPRTLEMLKRQGAIHPAQRMDPPHREPGSGQDPGSGSR